MRRDLDLFRKILLNLEEDGDLSELADQDAINYHLELMIEAGLLRGEIIETSDGSSAFLNDNRPITNSGHDLIDAIRADTLWRRVKERVSSLVGSVGLDVITALAKQEAMKVLGLPS
jgi:hypothetical protein